MKTPPIIFLIFASMLIMQTFREPLSLLSHTETVSTRFSEKTDDVEVFLQKKVSNMKLQLTHYAVTDKPSKELLATAMQKAVRIPGIVDMRPHDYEWRVIRDNRVSVYYLWLQKDKKQATLMDQADTHTAYRASTETTEQLRQIVSRGGMPPS